MADLLIRRVGPGVAIASSTDPFSSFRVHRLERERWSEAPDVPGLYVLYGLHEGAFAAYIGMSTASIRKRIANHIADAKKAWFGVVFAIPLATAHCRTVEAELIRLAADADVVSLKNEARETQWLDADDAHVGPALDGIVSALELLLGVDLFTTQDEPVVIGSTGVPAGKRAWTMDEWLAEARRCKGGEYAAGVEELAREWVLRGGGRRTEIGSGKTTTAVFLVVDADGIAYWPLAIYPTWVEVPFQWLAARPATQSVSVRLELLQKLNAIPGIALDEARIDKRPSFPPAVLADPTTRLEVLAVIDWFADEVNRQSGSTGTTGGSSVST